MATSNNKITIELYRPSVLQEPIHNAITKRERNIFLLICGRRWGKNIFALNDMAFRGCNNPDNIIWWCAPINKQAKRDYRRFKKGLKNTELIKKSWDSEQRIELYNDSLIEFHGLENHEDLAGEGLDYLYVDEIASIKQAAWEQTLQPMLLDNNGIAIGFGTPKGKNWVYSYFNAGQDMYNTQVKSYQFPTHTNPYIDRSRLEQDLARLPDRVVRQEYMAQFIDDGSGVFAGYTKCIRGEMIEFPEAGHHYRIGADIAKMYDFNFWIVEDIESKQVVNFMRFNKLDWSLTKQKLSNYAKFWNNAEVVLDSTGVGSPVFDDLRREGLRIYPFYFTNKSKVELIEHLAITIQNQNIFFPEIPELISELDSFEMNQTPSGNIKYSAPEGLHDDGVVSLALTCWDLKEIRNEFSIIMDTQDMREDYSGAV